MSVWRRVRAATALALIGLAGCDRALAPLTAADIAAIQRAALTTLFIEREGARQLVLTVGAIFDDASIARDDRQPDHGSQVFVEPDTAALALGIPVTFVSKADLEAHFKANADAWAALYKRFPGAPGLAMITTVYRERQRPNEASLFVSRWCGEHCRAVWRVMVARDDKGAWHTLTAVALSLPKS